MEELKNMNIEQNDVLVSFDVKSLFTKVPVDEAIDTVCDKLREDTTLTERTDLSVDSISKLMKLCFDCTYFQWQDEIYAQQEGAPMGLSLSVCIANAYMEKFEELALTTCTKKPKV